VATASVLAYSGSAVETAAPVRNPTGTAAGVSAATHAEPSLRPATNISSGCSVGGSTVAIPVELTGPPALQQEEKRACPGTPAALPTGRTTT
jgi:hypothetical protein